MAGYLLDTNVISGMRRVKARTRCKHTNRRACVMRRKAIDLQKDPNQLAQARQRDGVPPAFIAGIL